MIRIAPSDSRLRYMGRIGRRDPDAPAFFWCGSLVQFCFTGKTLRLGIENHSYDPWNGNGLLVGYVLDGRLGTLQLSPQNGVTQTLEIHADTDTSHTFRLYKRQDGSHHFILREILLDDGAALSVLALPRRKIEAFGDSVTAGCWVELCSHVGQNDDPDYTTRHDNAWHSYAMQTARLLDAQIHLTAQGGIALQDGTGYFECGRLGMKHVYDKCSYHPAAGDMTDWDFSAYIPDCVIFAIGQNDHRIGNRDNCTLCPAQRAHWLETYCGILRDLMDRYPNAQFVLLLTVLMHAEEWETLLDDACAMLGSERVHRFRFARSGKATPGHPRIPEQCEMACELTEYLQNLLLLHQP